MIPRCDSGRLVLPVAFGLLLILWPAALVGAAVAAAERPPSAPRVRMAALVYVAGGVICHQRPDRSFHLQGLPLPVCARCFGLYAAAPLGLILGVAGAGRTRTMRRARVLLIAAAVPTGATLAAEWAGVPVSSAVRAAAALPLGAAVAWILDGALRGRVG